MPYAKINKATSGLDKLAKTIAVPRDYKAERIPTFPALERTGVLSFTDTRTVTVPSGQSLYAMVCRDPAYPVWTSQQPNSGSAFSFYSVVSGSGDNYQANAGIYNSVPISPLANFYSISATSSIVGNFAMPLINYEDNLFFHNTTGRVGFQVNYATAPGACGVAFSMALIDSKHNVSIDVRTLNCSVTGLNTGFSYTLPADTVAFRVTSMQVTVTTTAVITTVAYGITSETISSASPLSTPSGIPPTVLFPITAPVEANATTVPWKAVRSTSVGALFSNVTAVLNKEGTIKSARLSVENSSVLYTPSYSTAIDKVYPKDRYFGPMENGLYTFTLPDLGSELYRDTLVNSNPLAVAVWGGDVTTPGIFDLDKLAYANIIQFTDIGSSDSTLAVTIDRHIEFRSSSVLFPLGYSTVPLESYHAAQMALVQLGVFFENPTHLGLIGAAVAQAVRSVASYAYPVVRQVGQAALMAAGDKIVSMANKKLGQMSQAKMVKDKPATRSRQLVVTKHTRVKTNKRK